MQLINAVDFYQKMRKSLGNKRNEICDEHIARDHPALRRVRRGRALQDFRQRGLRLPADHGRAAAAAELPGEPERIERLQEETALAEGEGAERGGAGDAGGDGAALSADAWTSGRRFRRSSKSAAKAAGIKLAAPVKKAVLARALRA